MPYLLLMPKEYNEENLFGLGGHAHILAGEREHTYLAQQQNAPPDDSQVKPPVITPVPGTIPT